MWTYHETHSSTVIESVLHLEIRQKGGPQNKVQVQYEDGRSGYSSKITNNSSLIAASVNTVCCRSTHGRSRNKQSVRSLVPSHLMSQFPGESSIWHLLDKIIISLRVCAMSCLHSHKAFTLETT